MVDPGMISSLRARWRNGDTTLGGWMSTPSTVMAEATARAGFDYVCIDTQHGAIEYSDAVPMIQAVLLGGASPIVRVPWNETGIIGKTLDAGAHGVIVPMVNMAWHRPTMTATRCSTRPTPTSSRRAGAPTSSPAATPTAR